MIIQKNLPKIFIKDFSNTNWGTNYLKILDNLSIELKTEEIIKLLKSPNSIREPPIELVEEIELLKKEALPLIHPKAIYDKFPSIQLKPRHLFEMAEETFLAICTISEDLENKVSELSQNGNLSQAVIFDAIASHAAEETAEVVNRIILEKEKESFHEKEHTARFSPGYCRWTVEEGQKIIFHLLPAGIIDVKLTNSFMMKPRKSISFAINIGRKVEEGLGIKECDTCEDYNCEYRR